jgi:spore maturation protein CgeB
MYNIFIPYDYWAGGFLNQISKGLSKRHEIIRGQKYRPSIFVKILFKLPINYFNKIGLKLKHKEFNKQLFESLKQNEIDYLFLISGGGIDPETLKEMKNINIKVIGYVADDPFNPSPHRDQLYPVSLQYYDILLVADKIWMRNIRLITNAKLVLFFGGYDPLIWSYEKLNHKDEFSSDILFTGGSYDLNSEGLFRALILNNISKLNNVSIWGDKGWKKHSNHLKYISSSYKGGRLDYNELNCVLGSCKIYLNMPSPQIQSSFQPRVFELGVSKVFQISPYSLELEELFGDSIVMFKNIENLEELINFYLNNDTKRIEKTEELYLLLKDNYTWANQLKKVLF